jgi:hypothetical protein
MLEILPLPVPACNPIDQAWNRAVGAYVRAAELDPDDPWTWIVLAGCRLFSERRKGKGS